MLKRVALIPLFLLIIFPLASAIEVDMKSEFSQGETLITKISGSFIDPPQQSDIIFKRGHVRVSIDPFLTKIFDNYYIYAILPEQENNYSMVIENTRYRIGTQISEEDLVYNFSTTSELADFSIKPGFVVTDKDFSVKLLNLQPGQITVDISTGVTSTTKTKETKGFFASLFGSTEIETETEDSEVSEGSVLIESGEEKSVKFKVPNAEESFLQFIRFNSGNTVYEMPTFVVSNSSTTKDFRSFKFQPNNLNYSFPTETESEKVLYLYNNGEILLENITLTLEDSLEEYITLSPDSIDELEPDSSVKITLTINSLEEENVIYGELRARASAQEGFDSPLYTDAEITLNFIPGFIPDPNNQDPTDPAAKTCFEMDGNFCKDGTTCSQEEVSAIDGFCCLGTCNAGNDDSLTGKIIGWGIIIALILAVVWFFFKKYRRARGPSTFLEKTRKKLEDQRLKDELEKPKRIKGKLGR